MNVSIIIPAHNAANTLAETLESVLAQTFTGWEAIVINDGSSDETEAVARSYANKDPRIRVANQFQMGVSMARNNGIKLARFDWLLFLDADDWLSPRHLERMTGTLAADASLDAVYCIWVRVAPEVDRLFEGPCSQEGDLFHLLATTCPFSIHACVVRRSVVVSLGGFDASLVTCEDWDLWQRIARTGARFGVVREALSFYRMRPDSASNNGFRIFTDGLLVIGRGHSSDPRVPHPRPENANGLPAIQLPTAMFRHMCWSAGIFLGRGQDATHLLNVLHNIQNASVCPDEVAYCIFSSSLLHACQPKTACDKFWPKIAPAVDDFLLALEKKSQVFGLVRRVHNTLERLILNNSAASLPLTLRTKHAVRFEVTEAITDIFPPASVERLYGKISLDGRNMDTLELPVCDGMVSRYVLSDAIASEFGWKILGCFFEQTVYRNLKVKKERTGVSLWRGDLRLAMNLPDDEPGFWPEAHNQCGWTVFLQEIWGLPDWPSERFYDPQAAKEASSARLSVRNNRVTIEVSQDMPNIEVTGAELNVLVTAGGAAIGVITIPAQGNIIPAQRLRAAITDACGFELCRVAVREGLIGKPMNEPPVTLRGRLAAAAAAVQDNGKNVVFSENIHAAETTDIFRRIISHGDHAIVFGRRAYGRIGTSISRRAMLPAAVAPDLIEAAAIAGEPMLQIPEPCINPSRVFYVPELIVHSSLQGGESALDSRASGTEEPQDATGYGQNYFEKIFTKPDPWKYTSPYEQKKYEQQLEMLPQGRIGRALEVACAEGHFTAQLASRVDNLIATDISPTALDRAIKRCAAMKNVQFAQLDLTNDPIPGRFELIVCSEVLYFVDGQENLKSVVRKLANALNPWGYLLTTHAQVVKDDPGHTGFDWDVPFGAKVIGETFANVRNLRLVKELWTPLYRIQLFQRVPRMYSFLYQDTSTPEVVELAQQPTELPPEVAADVLWDGKPSKGLPILMYHRVAPTGSPATSRYRVTPESFGEQLRYLRNAGYYSPSIEDWYAAREKNHPLGGRAVMITFDDGYRDFLTYAWPLLKRYGFTAMVFLVADCVGRTNVWDNAYGEELPLLGWEEIRQLQDEGVVFGSHSVSHPYLTALSAEGIVREGARSRAILGRKLGKKINTFAYPYGDADRVVQHCIGACGYIFGLTTQNGLSTFHDPLLALPRIEVYGSDKIKDFVEKLSIC